MMTSFQFALDGAGIGRSLCQGLIFGTLSARLVLDSSLPRDFPLYSAVSYPLLESQDSRRAQSSSRA
jgi:hypothetical protein